MAVVLQQQGTVLGAVTTGNLTVNLPAYIANDIVVITTVGYVPNGLSTNVNTQTLASPWTKYSPDVVVLDGSNRIDSEHAFWWARATSVNSLGASVSITRPTGWDTGTDTVWAGRAYVIRGCRTTGDPFDALVATAPSAAANPTLPAVTVNGNDRLVIAFYVASDNVQAPTAATGYTPQTALTTNTGTDAGFQSYTDLTNTTVSAVTPTGGATTAQNFQVYFSASFAPPIEATAKGYGSAYQSSFFETSTGAATLTTANPHYGMGFKTETTNNIDSVYVDLRRTASPTGNVVVQLWSAGTGTYGSTQIPGTLLATSDGIDSATISTTTERKKFVFTGVNRVSITADTAYYLVVYHANAQAATNFISVAYVRGTYATASGNGVYSFSNGTSFTADSPATDVVYAVELASATFAAPPILRTATGSGVGTETAIDLLTALRTATGSGLGTETATGARVGLVYDRTADGSGVGTQSAVWQKSKPRTAFSLGTSAFAAYRDSPTSLFQGILGLSGYLDAAAVSFVGNGKTISSIGFILVKNGTPSGNITAYIYAATVGNLPTGSPLATGEAKLASSITTSASEYTRFTFTGSNRITLSDGVTYCAVIVSDSGVDASNYIEIKFVSSTALGSSVPYKLSRRNKNTGVWNATGNPPIFNVETASAIGAVVLSRTATGSGIGAETATGAISKDRTATGSGTGTEFADGSRVAVVYDRTASGSGTGTQTAVGVKGKNRIARGIGHSAISAQPYVSSSITTVGITTFWIAQTFAGKGTVLDSIRISMRENGNIGNTVAVVDIYALTGTLSSGTPTGSVLATSGNVTVPTSSVGPPTFFPFTGANRIVLSEGVNYAFVVRWVSGTNDFSITLQTDVNLVEGAYVSSSNSGGSWTVFGAARELSYGVYGADAVGGKILSKTATGSGTGTESTNSLVVGIRTATGTGSGTSTADSFKTPIRTASANGVSSSTADTFHNKVRSASGSGGASPSAIAIGLHISIRTATGNGSGNSDSTIRLTILRTASGNGVGSSVSEEMLIHVRSATGSGTGTSTVVVQLIAIRTASGSGLGTQTVVSNKVKLRTARNRAKADTLDYWDDSGLAGANWYYQALNTSSGISRYGQSFQATKTVTLDSAEFLLHKLGAPPGNVRAQLYASTGFSNIGALLATSEPVSASTLLGPFPETSSSAYWDETWKPTKFTFSGNQRVQITSGTNYVIVLDYDGYPTSDNSNTVRITYQYTPDAVAVEHPGIRFRYLPGSSSWTTNSTQDVVFAVVHATTFAAVSTVIAKTARSSGYADATTITDNSGFVTDTDFSDYISSTRFAAQSFLGNGKVIDSLLGHISYETTPPATLNYVYAEIWTHTGTFGVDGLPGTLLATSNAVPNTALGLNVWDETNLVKFTFSGSQKIMLTNATPYYVVWRYTGTDTSDQIGVSYWLQSSYKAIQVSTGNSAYKGSSGLWTAYADLYPLIIFPATALSFVDLLRLATGSGTGTQNSFGKNAEIGINWSYWGSRILI